MERLFKSVLSIRELKFHVDDDYVDRLSRQFTVVITVCFAFLVSTKQFVGRPIHCWCPAEFTESHVDYTNSICWVSNTFYLPMSRPSPWQLPHLLTDSVELVYVSRLRDHHWMDAIRVLPAHVSRHSQPAL